MEWPESIPRYDLHKHFGGSIRPATVAKLLGRPNDVEAIAKLMVCKTPVNNFSEFLERFNVLNEVRWTEQAIAESIEQVVKDQANDKVAYSEISFSINKYLHNHIKWTRAEIVKFISGVFNDACGRHNTIVKLILSLRMESDRDSQRNNAKLIDDCTIVDAIDGIDIVGDERKFNVDLYQPIYHNWRTANKVTLAHAGETCGPQNILDAITKLRVHRVRHGIACVDDDTVLEVARDHMVCFDISLHSNWLAGTVRNMNHHHLPILLNFGSYATLGTDDPAIFDCNLDSEYTLARNYGLLGDTDDVISEAVNFLRLNSIRFAAANICSCC